MLPHVVELSSETLLQCSVSSSRSVSSTFSLSKHFAPPTPPPYSQHGFRGFVHGLLHYYCFVRLPTIFFSGFAEHFPEITTAGTVVVSGRISRVPYKRHPYMHQVYDSGESTSTLTLTRCGHVAFPFRQQGQHSQSVISELNTEPAHSSVNA